MSKITMTRQEQRLANGVTVVMAKLQGEIDDYNDTLSMQKALDEIVQLSVKYVILDVSEIGYINSSGIATLINITDHFRQAGGDLKLVKVSPKMSSIWQLMGLSSYLIKYEDEQAAIASILESTGQ